MDTFSLIWLILFLLVIVVSAAYKLRTPAVQNFNQGLAVFDDFLEPNYNTTAGSYTGAYFITNVANSGTVASGSSAAYPGYVQMSIGSTTDKAGIAFASSLYPTNSSILVTETRCTLAALTVSGQAEMYFGFSITPNGIVSSVSNLAAFVYDNSISGNWIVQVNNAGVVSKQITTVPVTLNDTYLKVIVVPNYVYFYLNNVLVGTFTNTFLAVPMRPTWLLTKGTGTLGLSIKTDAVGVYQQYITPRIFSNTVITQ